MYGCQFGAGSGFGMGGPWSAMLLPFVVAGLLVWLGIGLLHKKPGHADQRDSLRILKRRLASGEITLEEFEALKKVL